MIEFSFIHSLHFKECVVRCDTALASLISPLSSQHKPIKLVHYTSAQDVHVSIRSCILSCSKDMSSITFEVNLQKCSDLAR